MPDENSTQVWANQTSTNQSENDNDFVLDFWNSETWDQTNEAENMELQQSDIINEENNSDSDNETLEENADELFDNVENNWEDWNNLNSEDNSSAENTTEWNMDDDLGFSFDDNTDDKNKENTDDTMQNFDETEDKETSDNNATNGTDSDMGISEESTQQDIWDDIDFQETTSDSESSQDKEDNKDFDMDFNMENDDSPKTSDENEVTNENLENDSKDTTDNNEMWELSYDENNNEESEWDAVLNLPDDIISDESVDEEETDNNVDTNTDSSNGEDNGEDMFWDSSLFDNNGAEWLNDKENLGESKKNSGISENQNSEMDNKIIPNNFSLDEVASDAPVSVVGNSLNPSVSIEDNKLQDAHQENTTPLNSNNNFNQDKISDAEVAVQPDISNLLWSEAIDLSETSQVDFSEDSQVDFTTEVDDFSNNDANQDSMNLNNPDLPEEDNTTTEQEAPISNELSEENKVDDGDSLREDNLNEKNLNEKNLSENNMNNTETPPATEPVINNETTENTAPENDTLKAQADQVNEVSNEKTMQQNEKPSESAKPIQMGSTLSLDEILDSELHSNPQYSDHSTAVPKNVPAHSNKKTIAIVLWMFILTWCVVVMAFPWLIPLDIMDRKPWDTVSTTWDVKTDPEDTTLPIEEDPYESDYTSEGDPVSEWDDTWEGDTSQHGITTESTGQLPTVEYGEVDTTWGSESEDAKVYTGDFKSVDDTEIEEVPIETIREKISYYREIEKQYSKTLENQQNAKAQSYTSYLKYWCNTYEAQIEAWEWLDSESFNSFISESERTIGKIKSALWDTDDEVYTVENN